jgi:hypothetical protein
MCIPFIKMRPAIYSMAVMHNAITIKRIVSRIHRSETPETLIKDSEKRVQRLKPYNGR